MIKTVVKIDGMMCGMCESHINDAIRQHFAVKKVKSSKRKKETVIVSESALEQDKVKEVIEQTGYTFLSMDSE